MAIDHHQRGRHPFPKHSSPIPLFKSLPLFVSIFAFVLLCSTLSICWYIQSHNTNSANFVSPHHLLRHDRFPLKRHFEGGTIKDESKHNGNAIPRGILGHKHHHFRSKKKENNLIDAKEEKGNKRETKKKRQARDALEDVKKNDENKQEAHNSLPDDVIEFHGVLKPEKKENNPLDVKEETETKKERVVNDVLEDDEKNDEDKDSIHDILPDIIESDENENIPLDVEEEKIETKKEKLARGIAGLPMSQTPALEGAHRGSIQCNGTVNANALAYWNEPQGERDVNFVSPFAVKDGTEKYLSFEMDVGGWNNIRMSLENIFIIAVAMNRTLILPPDQDIYLLASKKSKGRKFGQFYPLHTEYFQKRLKTISTADFLEKEGRVHGKLPIREDMKQKVLAASHSCEFRNKSETACMRLYDHYSLVGNTPEFYQFKTCVIFDKDVYEGREMSAEHSEKALEFCAGRDMLNITSTMQDSTLIHFHSSELDNRFQLNFYGALHFTDPAVDNFFKRFVRDYLHYVDPIYCAASKIITSLQEESLLRGFETDEEGGGGYSSLHVRRGDLQFKDEKISAAEWYNNTKELWKENEILYIATDERNKTFFDDLKEHHDLRFLDDYWDMAGLEELDSYYMGMIDTIVASRGRKFVGTYFSTFSAFINRLRGYYGMSMKDSYYGTLMYKNTLHEWRDHNGPEFSHEWPYGWMGIDGDEMPSREIF